MTHISALTWFSYESKSLSLGAWLGLRVHLVRCAACREQYRRRQALAPLQMRAPRTWGLVAIAGAAAAAAVVLLTFTVQRSPLGDELTMKGSSRFVLHQVNAVLRGECQPGDVLQGEVFSSRPFGLVILLSESGAHQVLFPPGGNRSAVLKDRSVRMPNSWTVDREVGRERFIALFSDRPLVVSDVLSALVQGQALADVEVVEHRCTKSPSVPAAEPK